MFAYVGRIQNLKDLKAGFRHLEELMFLLQKFYLDETCNLALEYTTVKSGDKPGP